MSRKERGGERKRRAREERSKEKQNREEEATERMKQRRGRRGRDPLRSVLHQARAQGFCREEERAGLLNLLAVWPEGNGEDIMTVRQGVNAALSAKQVPSPYLPAGARGRKASHAIAVHSRLRGQEGRGDLGDDDIRADGD